MQGFIGQYIEQALVAVIPTVLMLEFSPMGC